MAAELHSVVEPAFVFLTDDSVASKTSPIQHSVNPSLYFSIFAAWLFAVVWFQPRLWQLLSMANDAAGLIVLGAFIFFINLAWLYGIYNLAIVVFALWYDWRKSRCTSEVPQPRAGTTPAVAVLYMTCNDFVEASALSCVEQDYPNFTVYILDDSSDPEIKSRIDDFAARHGDSVQVVRRADRAGFKAGNLNHGLTTAATEEPYFAVADADEILPPHFLSSLVPLLENDPRCGFVQANHRCNPETSSQLARDQGLGIDIHWRWYQPLRNAYGFVMFLGHGALLRRSCWEEIGGFPQIVSEDLAYALEIRERGYRGRFVEHVVCYEEFPETVRAFRIRHMKWTRGTCEFLTRYLGWLLRARNISWAEKCDVIFPTMNLPLTLLYLLFMVNANILIPLLFGECRDITFVTAGREFTLPFVALNSGFGAVHGWDFFAITMLTFFSPVLCFVLSLAFRPLRLARFLCHSTALYAALSPLSSIGVLAYLASGQATFLVTGDVHQVSGTGPRQDWRTMLRMLLARSHPDSRLVQGLELTLGLTMGIMSIVTLQLSFGGLCIAFLLLPVMHHLGWENVAVRALVYVPFALILIGLGLASLSMLGMQSVFFGYGFHF